MAREWIDAQVKASDYFTKKCFQQPANAYEEARRGAYNPTYLYYTLGKLEIYKLRADYQRTRGAKLFTARVSRRVREAGCAADQGGEKVVAA